jgi:hypothetical protein
VVERKESSEMKLPKVDAQTGYMVTCSHKQCGPVGFAAKRVGRDELIAAHLAEHKAHNDRVSATLARLAEQEDQAAEISGVRIDPVLVCPGDKCGVPIGFPHEKDCDVARCLVTGTQRALIEHIKHLDPSDREEHKCGADVWTGYWPGDYEAAKYGTTRNDVLRHGTWDVALLEWVMPVKEETK